MNLDFFPENALGDGPKNSRIRVKKFITLTGTMAFFDCHRKIVFREAEGNFWSSFENRNDSKPELSYYAVPMASPDEILIEKTPHIIKRGYNLLKYRAELIKETISGVKLIVMLCDPVKRFISMEKHHTPKNWPPTPRDKLTGIELNLAVSIPSENFATIS